MKWFKTILNIWGVILAIVVTWLLIQQLYINPKRLESEKVRYSIGEITNFVTPSDGGQDVNFVYIVNGRTYKHFFASYERNVQTGDRFYVKFVESDPNNCDILLDQPVNDKIEEAPVEGWERLPF